MLEMVNAPVAAPAAVGSNVKVSAAVWPGLKVTGNARPDIANPVPLIVAELTVAGTFPVEVRTSDCVVGTFTVTPPKDTLVALALIAGVAAFSCMAKVTVPLFSVAERVAVCAEVTDETVAVNDALAAPAGTITEAGTVTILLLLARLTLTPPLAAATRHPFSKQKRRCPDAPTWAGE